MNPLITYVIASRNDGYCGNPMERLVNTLNSILHKSINCEIIVVDWGSEEPIVDEVVGQIPYTNKTRFVMIPPHVTNNFLDLHKAPFPETIALNVGFRLAKGDFCGRLDQDTMIGDAFAGWVLSMLQYRHELAWFSTRRDLRPGSLNIDNAEVWKKMPLASPEFYKAAVGILIAPASILRATKGYNESMLYRNHMEHDLCYRLNAICGLNNLAPIVGADFYHQWHPEVIDREHNKMPTDDELEWVLKKPRPKTWGLEGITLREEVL